MLNNLQALDQWLFLAINGWNHPNIDPLMYWISNKYFWIPFYLYLLYHSIRKTGKQWWLILISVVLLILVSDQSSFQLKNYFMRLRPCHSPELEGLVHTVFDKCGGKYGFVSSHASNSFAIATFFSFIFTNRIFRMALLTYALLVSYSRIYLGVHYPGDILFGAILGIFVGIILFKLYKLFLNRLNAYHLERKH